MMASYITLFVPSPPKKSQPHQKYQLQIDGTIVLITQMTKKGFSWRDVAVTSTFLLTTRARYTYSNFPPLAAVGPPTKSGAYVCSHHTRTLVTPI